MIEPSKINQFKYLIDKFLSVTNEDGSASVLNSIDGYANLLSIVLSQKKNEEIQEELLDLVGVHNFELLSQLIEKRDLIKEQCKSIEENLKKEKAHETYRPKNFDVGVNKVGVQVDIQTGTGGKD